MEKGGQMGQKSIAK